MTVCIACEHNTISAFVAEGLAQMGTVSHKVATGAEVQSLLGNGTKALIVDLEISGIESVLENTNGTPVVALVHTKHPYEGEPSLPKASARVKMPFCLAEVIRGLEIAQNNGESAPSLQVGDLVLDYRSGIVRREGRALRFYPQGQLLLEHFMRNPETVITREYILENFFDYTANPRPNLVDVLISRMRSALDKGFANQMLVTVRGKGYMLRP